MLFRAEASGRSAARLGGCLRLPLSTASGVTQLMIGLLIRSSNDGATVLEGVVMLACYR